MAITEANSESTEPTLSIIMPVYNIDAYLEQSIDSVIRQTFTDWELIIVDDGSTDNSPAICDKYATLDRRIKVKHIENSGISVARNTALSYARGKYIGFVDSDDWIEPEMFAQLINAIERMGADIAMCSYYLEFKNLRKQKYPMPIRPVITHDEAMLALFHDDSVRSYLWDKLFRREIVQNTSFNEGQTFEDLAIMHQWMDRAARVAIVNAPLYHYRMRRSSTVNCATIQFRIDRLKADIQRAHYYMEHPVEGLDEQQINAAILKSAVNCAKHIARYSQGKSEVYKSLRLIVQMVEPFLHSGMGHVSGKIRSRIKKLRNNTHYFRWQMLITRYLTPGNLKRDNNLYA